MNISRMNKGEWGKVRAFFDLTTSDGFTIKGFKLVEGINGLFVGFPSEKGSDDEIGDPVYRDTVWAEKEVKEQVNVLALQRYNDPTNGGEAVLELVEKDNKKMVVESEEDLPF